MGHDRATEHMTSQCACMHKTSAQDQGCQNPSTNWGRTQELLPLAEELLAICDFWEGRVHFIWGCSLWRLPVLKQVSVLHLCTDREH